MNNKPLWTNKYGIVFYRWLDERDDDSYQEIRVMFTCDNYFDAEKEFEKYNKDGWQKSGPFYLDWNQLEYYTEDLSVLN